MVRAASIAAHAAALQRQGFELDAFDPVGEINGLGFGGQSAVDQADEVLGQLGPRVVR